jgi:hypothetical protein
LNDENKFVIYGKSCNRIEALGILETTTNRKLAKDIIEQAKKIYPPQQAALWEEGWKLQEQIRKLEHKMNKKNFHLDKTNFLIYLSVAFLFLTGLSIAIGLIFSLNNPIFFAGVFGVCYIIIIALLKRDGEQSNEVVSEIHREKH